MNIVQITPGAGAMFCGNCFRDNALVLALRKQGHDALMVPLYLPLTLDEEDQSAGTPIFFSGINVYLQQKSPLFREAPDWFRNLFTSRSLLKWAAAKAAKTRAEELGDLTLSILRGEEGNQARELEELIAWLKTQPKPDVICLSNVLLIGLVRQFKAELNVPVVCMLQGEDSFLDALPMSDRELCWKTVAERATEADLFIAPSRYFADLMRKRLALDEDRVRVVHNGINLSGYLDEPKRTHPPVIGYFARMCKEKGLDTLVDAYIELRKRGAIKDVKLRIGGGCGPGDEPFVKLLKQRLDAAGVLAQVEFHPNLDHAGKVAFLRSLSVFSVPARYGEAFGLYVIEAMAAGVPVVQPRAAAFPELVEASGGGLLCDAENVGALSNGIEELLLNASRAQALGEAGRRAVFERFSAEAMAQQIVEAYRQAIRKSTSLVQPVG
jgi:glycosyltransferase involved in cell wall biosynthesis